VIAAVHAWPSGRVSSSRGRDIRFVVPDAQFSVLEIRWGLTPDMTATVTLTRLVSLDVAKELVFTGRIVSGEEAGRLGLATHVTGSPLEDALALAREIAAKNPHASTGPRSSSTSRLRSRSRNSSQPNERPSPLSLAAPIRSRR